MKKKRSMGIWAISIAIVILMLQVIGMMYLVHYLQGNARVVNYAGIVRGATQRLVKNELCNNPRDDEIDRLDDILLGLQTGKGEQKLTVLQDSDYLAKLQLLSMEWENVKAAIYAARENEENRTELYRISEQYFILADETVSAAETYSDGIAKRTSILEMTISITIVFIVFFFIVEMITEMQKNHKLNKLAYIDPQTGLPNKRACEEKIADVTVIDPQQNVCFMMFDLNNLKVTNDTLGHEAGDALICTFASLLRRNMPDKMFVGRLGGDEFIGIHMNAVEDEITASIQQLKAECGQMDQLEAVNHLRISFAYGCAYSKEQDNMVTMKALMNVADKNMYHNKAKVKKGLQEKDEMPIEG